ncbi:TetR/AcrR family transcriptional regulator [Solimonas variicoloris]|uniref:TetR/AcrR family transcriptional regulator n=1 Tax=Solimonas variicoloris TaxID=254408 RepID=UPI00036CCA9B|nr:TetR/AcrR family transcriptional regulator [Solimonas variicoloris]
MSHDKRATERQTPEGGMRVRDRIFKTARELFYRQGIRAVGVDDITSGAGTNKMSFYRSFASKDELVTQCLRAQEGEYWAWWDEVIAPHAGDPRAQIEALFEASARKARDVERCGCAISNAAVELRDDAHPGHAVIHEHKMEKRRRLRELAAAAGARDADALGDALMLLLEGSAATRLTFSDCETAPLCNALAGARALLDAQLAPPRAARRG